MSETKRFNVRIYGLLFRGEDEVLLSDEQFKGWEFTKFPGGGLEWGEGTKEGLIREFKEELDIDVTVKEIFYVAEDFVTSFMSPSDQVISIYYIVDSLQKDEIKTSSTVMDFNGVKEQQEAHRWVKLKDLTLDSVTFPIDKKVVEKLMKMA